MHDLVILTGHSSGLGLAILEELLQGPYKVIAIAQRRLARVQDNLLEISCDLSQPIGELLQELRTAIDLQVAALRSITLINNAANSGPIALAGHLDFEAMARSVALNVAAPMQLMNLLAGYQSQVFIRLLQISSGAAHKSYPGWMVYCSCKAAIRMSAQVLAAEAELAGSGLRVLIYEPGILDTPMQTELRTLGKEQFPGIDRFLNLYKEGQLVAPKDSARQLVRLWQDPTRPPFEEVRYDPKFKT